jgi:hypothetical protein
MYSPLGAALRAAGRDILVIDTVSSCSVLCLCFDADDERAV